MPKGSPIYQTELIPLLEQDVKDILALYVAYAMVLKLWELKFKLYCWHRAATLNLIQAQC